MATVKHREVGGYGYGWVGMTPKNYKRTITRAVNQFSTLVMNRFEFDAIAFTGSSGCAIAFPLALKYEVPLMYVRKEKEKSHGCRVEINQSIILKRYVIVDDFVATGSTVRRVKSQLDEFAKSNRIPEPELLCIYGFEDSDREIHVDGKIIPLIAPQ